jgi:hypothetical protein
MYGSWRSQLMHVRVQKFTSQGRVLLLGPGRDDGDRDPLEESLRELAAEDRRQHLVGEGAEEVEVNAAKCCPCRLPLDPPDDAEHSGRGGNNRHAIAPCTLPIAVAVRLGGVLDPLGVRHDHAPFAQPARWRPACAQPGCTVLTLIG